MILGINQRIKQTQAARRLVVERERLRGVAGEDLRDEVIGDRLSRLQSSAACLPARDVG